MQPTPHQELARLMSGYWLSQAVYVAAKLGLADALHAGPRTAVDLARESGAHAPSLYRLLRALASIGIFAEDDDARFTLTPLAEPLRSDVPGSQRALAIMMGEEHYRAYGDLLGSVCTGQTAFDKIFGKPVFDYLAGEPVKAAIFDEAMTGIHGRETAAMLDSYDFSGVRLLADIGGGNGSTLAAVLERHPPMRGILFDLPGVVERAKERIEAAGLAARCQLVEGNFFESVPGSADAYLFRHILHDWNDEQALTILRNCRARVAETARLLVVETVIPPGNDFCFGKLLDLTMLVIPGGKERTEEEYRQLFATAGFRLARVVPTAADVSVIEGEPA